MPTTKPRLTVTLPEQVYATVQRVAAVQGGSMSSVIVELVESMEPGLRRIADLGEAMDRATEEQRQAMRDAVAVTDERLAGPLAEAMGISVEVLREYDRLAAGLSPDDPPSSNQGGHNLHVLAQSRPAKGSPTRSKRG